MSGTLQDKVAIVTGAASGIGRAVVRRFAEEGAWIVVNGLPSDPVDEVVAELQRSGCPAVGHQVDISRAGQAEECIQTAQAEFGRLDILVNNAGVLLDEVPLEEYSIEDFEKLTTANIRKAFMMTRFALPLLQRSRGNVLFNGSEAGLNGKPFHAVYGASKGWIHAFARGVAVEQAPHGVRVNCVCPGPVETPMTADAARQEVALKIPLGRFGTPAEIAHLFAFLASEEASFITGALYFIDGGECFAKGNPGACVPDHLRRPPQEVAATTKENT